MAQTSVAAQTEPFWWVWYEGRRNPNNGHRVYYSLGRVNGTEGVVKAKARILWPKDVGHMMLCKETIHGKRIQA